MYVLSKKRASAQPKRLAYVHKICELSRRGDISAVAELMKGYYSDKKAHPWHTIYKDIEKYWTKENPKKDVSEALILIRDVVFGALDILSLSIPLDVPTSEFVELFTDEANWMEGRRKVRNRCIELVGELIKKKKTRHLVPSALERDGLGFLVSEIEETELEIFKKAKPEIKKVPKKKKQVLDLSSLEKCKTGSKFLREQMIMKRYIEKGDPRIPGILEAYDHFLVELEVDISASTSGQILTEQVTLNGKPVTEVEDEKARFSKKQREKAEQSALTDFIEEEPTKPMKKAKKPSGQGKRRVKKK